MYALVSPGFSLLYNSPEANTAKSRRFLGRGVKPCSSMRKQSRQNLRNTWPTISLSLFGSGFLLGPLIDGLHSRVHLVVYQNGSFNIGPLHSNVWVSFVFPFLCHPSFNCVRCCPSFYVYASQLLQSSFLVIIDQLMMFLGSLSAWFILLHRWVASTLHRRKVLFKDSYENPTSGSCFIDVSSPSISVKRPHMFLSHAICTFLLNAEHLCCSLN